MKQIDPIISIIAMAIVSVAIGALSSIGAGVATFMVLFLAGIAGDKIMGNVPNSHD